MRYSQRLRMRRLGCRILHRHGGRGVPVTHYQLPSNYNAAYHLVCDGVAAPVAGHLAAHLLEPILAANTTNNECACDPIKEPKPVYGSC